MRRASGASIFSTTPAWWSAERCSPSPWSSGSIISPSSTSSALLNLLLAGVVASRCCGRAARIAVWSAAAAVVALAAGVESRCAVHRRGVRPAARRLPRLLPLRQARRDRVRRPVQLLGKRRGVVFQPRRASGWRNGPLTPWRNVPGAAGAARLRRRLRDRPRNPQVPRRSGGLRRVRPARSSGAAAKFLPGEPQRPANPRHLRRRAAVSSKKRRRGTTSSSSTCPIPSTSQLNRFYTREFFAEVRRILVPGGRAALSLGQYEGYLGQAMAGVLAVAHRTLNEVYANVLIVPRGKRSIFSPPTPR